MPISPQKLPQVDNEFPRHNIFIQINSTNMHKFDILNHTFNIIYTIQRNEILHLLQKNVTELHLFRLYKTVYFVFYSFSQGVRSINDKRKYFFKSNKHLEHLECIID